MRTRTALLAVIAASMAVSACTFEGAVSATPSPVLAVADTTPPSVTPRRGRGPLSRI